MFSSVVHTLSGVASRAAAPGAMWRAQRAASAAVTTCTRAASSGRDDRLAGFDAPTVWAEMTPLANEHNAINLGQGFPDWETPQFVKEEAIKAVRDNHNQYGPPRGHPLLLNALARTQSASIGKDLNPNTEITVTVGAAEAMFNCMQAFVEKGDEVIMLEPFFDTYPATVQMAGGVPRYVPLRPPTSTGGAMSAGDFGLDMDELEAAFNDKTRVLILNTPHNPTGKALTTAEMEAIANIVRKYPDVVVVADEVYDHIEFVGGHKRFASIDGMFDRTVTMSSAAKTFSVTGWKIGWCMGPAPLINRIALVSQWIQFCIATPFQVAIANVFDAADKPYEGFPNFYAHLNDLYAGKAKLLSEGLQEAGLTPVEPQGTFFIMADTSAIDVPEEYLNASTAACPKMTRDWALARQMTIEGGVTAIPPSAFVTDESKPLWGNFLRLAFCKQDASIKEACARLKRFTGKA